MTEQKQLTTNDSPLVMTAIEHLALNPDIDVSKLQPLLDFQERILNKKIYSEYCVAFTNMQAELPEIDQKGAIEFKGKVQSRYAKFEDINEAVKPILKKHGFAISFRTKQTDDKIITKAVLTHISGHSETTEILLAPDNSGSKNSVQAVGSAISYGKRYAMSDLLNITTRGLDDDATQSDPVATPHQIKVIKELLVGLKPRQRMSFTKTFGPVETIKKSDVDTVMARIRNKLNENEN